MTDAGKQATGLWGVQGASGTVMAVHSQLHAEAMVEAMASMGITVEAVEWPDSAEEHAADMAESAKWEETAQ